jgi:SNF2 family DNA or RNA helicase
MTAAKTANADRAQQKLAEIRTRKDLVLKPMKHLKSTYTDFDGTEKPLRIRYYQVQGIMHLVVMRRFLLGDDTGIGKTLQAIGALCAIWEKDPNRKVIALTTKSATKQWAREFAKFTTGVKVVVGVGTPKQRAKARALFEKSTGPTVFISGYRAIAQDFTYVQDWKDSVLIADEATVFKNPKTRIHQVCRHLSDQADRVWALTATLIKNNLVEGHGIFAVLTPGLFGSQNNFVTYYCITRLQRLPRSNRMIPIVVGYSPDRVKEFRDAISPYFLGRPKYEVASELPALVQQTIEVELTKEQEAKYDEALSGLLTMGDDEKETTKLTQVTYCQEICDHLSLIDCEGDSGKLATLIDLLTQGDFAGEKVIVFSRFRKMIDILEPVLKTNKIPTVRVTGSENDSERDAAMRSFQDPNSATRVCFITMAGSDSINLQAAKAIIFFDTPWSAGDYIQIIGRMIRIGSEQDRCYAVHLVGKLKTRKTIDHRVMEVQTKKMNLVEAVIGKRIKGVEDANTVISVENDISELFAGLKQDARSATT